MGIVKNNVLSGMVGAVVVYQWKGKSVMRSRPSKYKNTKASQQAAKDFGRAAKVCRNLRHKISRDINDFKNQGGRYRLENAIRHWIRSSKALNPTSDPFFLFERFQFNESCSLIEKLKAMPTVDWRSKKNIVVEIPEMVPTKVVFAPQFTKSITWVIEVSGTSMDGRGSDDGHSYARNVFSMPYDAKKIEAQKITIPFPIISGHIIIVSLALKYNFGSMEQPRYLMNEAWLPSGIVGYCFVEKA
jgi:hypothetical protein